MIRVFIGFDVRETAAFHVLSQSIHAHASEPVKDGAVRARADPRAGSQPCAAACSRRHAR